MEKSNSISLIICLILSTGYIFSEANLFIPEDNKVLVPYQSPYLSILKNKYYNTPISYPYPIYVARYVCNVSNVDLGHE